MTIRIAMWSGPRNLSTAMMRSFGSRPDTTPVDEPFYAAYLALTGTDHPMRLETVEAHETDPRRVANWLAGGSISTPIVYQKHMTHHMIEGVPRDWMAACRHAFLIRHPARVLASYAKKSEAVSLHAIGFLQQWELFEEVSHQLGSPPAVVDSDDILAAPEAVLTKLCTKLDIPFDGAMLSWQPGPKPEDGAWAPHWYDAVNSSTGFGGPPDDLPEVIESHRAIHDAALPVYEALGAFKL